MTANFNKQTFAGADKETEVAIARAIAFTLRQFKGVRGVKIQIDGAETPLIKEATTADTVVQQPSPPRLVSLTAMKDKGDRDIEEVDAFFDRPVEIKELKILSQEGKPFEGEIYHSVFDMAAVLKPKDPSRFQEGMPVQVRWKVIDKVGRSAEGEDMWQLQVIQHEE